MSKRIAAPASKEEFDKYYQLRWEVLRKPWGQPFGSEKDDVEAISEHLMCIDESGEIIGVCRVHFNSETEAQIRYMAVQPSLQMRGAGKMLAVNAIEIAKLRGAKRLVLHAREQVVGFYEKCGFKVVEKSYVLFGGIQHYLMEMHL